MTACWYDNLSLWLGSERYLATSSLTGSITLLTVFTSPAMPPATPSTETRMLGSVTDRKSAELSAEAGARGGEGEGAAASPLDAAWMIKMMPSPTPARDGG